MNKTIVLVGIVATLMLLSGCVDVSNEYEIRYNDDSVIRSTITGEQSFLDDLHLTLHGMGLDYDRINHKTLTFEDVLSKDKYIIERQGFFIRKYVTYIETDETMNMFENNFEVTHTISVPGNIQEVVGDCEIVDNKAVCETLPVGIKSSCGLFRRC